MESFVIALISLLLVLPIIYFLPLGFTRKGKLLILFCAFFVFVIGIAAKTVMSVLQTGIVLIMLAIGFSYIIGKRFGTQLFLHPENTSGIEEKVIKFEIEDEVEEEIRSQIKIAENKDSVAEQENVPPPTQEADEEIVEEIETTDNQIEDDLALENVFVETEDLENTYEVHTNNENPDSDFDDLLKEIEMGLNDKNSDIQDQVEMVEATEDPDEIQPVEIAEMEDEDVDITPPVLEEIQFDSLQVNAVDESNEQSEIEEIPFIESTDSDLNEIEVESTEEDDSMNEQQIEQEIQNQMEDITELEELEDIELDSSENKQNNEIEVDDGSSYIVDEESNIELERDDQNNLRQQLFTTMISQIKLSRNKLSTTQYEELIMGHLHPNLSDHDYYTFVSLLIEHYIKTEQNDELLTILSQNKSRFEKYPVILQEINFLLEEYCKI
ncbi:hypothetical protein E1I69_00180 [Bacillus timonensis]|uniref:Uncharacterized protein n=1 Tax=Bacillus timonensis TaxID=1033734 RepID=A0A4S3PZE1_9BACI|nr:acyltransferase [Bacillus timonensis]THE15301.1 hypothetical protein E1I69_00180 [Bacillus timonensis]